MNSSNPEVSTMTILIHEQHKTVLPDTCAQDGHLWLDRGQILEATGWDWKPEGLCKDDLCFPVPPARRGEWVQGDRLDLAEQWQHMGRPVVNDPGQTAWVFGADAQSRAQTLHSLQAPDFELPDLQGQLHRLSDTQGQRTLLVTWSSW
jgi:hypothetical protein